jgi:plastocyanin
VAPRRLLPALCALGLIPASPAAAAEVAVAQKSFAPGDVSIAPGEAVTWRWTGDGHNVRVIAGPQRFDSGFKDAGGVYAHTFQTPGTYAYVCDAHPDMRGAVTVAGAAPAAPAVAAPTAGAVDAAPPRLRAVRVSKLAVVRFTASASGTVRVRITRRGRTLRRATAPVVAGRNRLPLRVRGLRRGRYRLILQAVDAAGRPSASAVRVLVVTRAALARRPAAPPAFAPPPVTPPPVAPPPVAPPPPAAPPESDDSGRDGPGDND